VVITVVAGLRARPCAGRAARKAQGLARSLANTVITTYGHDFATSMTEFPREGRPQIGRQRPTWARLPQGWQVVAAHVSLIDPPAEGAPS